MDSDRIVCLGPVSISELSPLAAVNAIVGVVAASVVVAQMTTATVEILPARSTKTIDNGQPGPSS